jgi:hypothetical protein
MRAKSDSLSSDGAFDRNGFFAKLLEDVPFVGLVVAGLHLNAGNLVKSYFDPERRALSANRICRITLRAQL